MPVLKRDYKTRDETVKEQHFFLNKNEVQVSVVIEKKGNSYWLDVSITGNGARYIVTRASCENFSLSDLIWAMSSYFEAYLLCKKYQVEM